MPKWLSVGDFAEYETATLALYNATHYIQFLNFTGVLRWEVIGERVGVVELAVSLNVTGKAGVVSHGGEFHWRKKETFNYSTYWLSIYKSVVLTVNVSSREAKYMGHDIGYIPFWVDRMPAKGQRIPMVKLENGSILHGEVTMVLDRDIDWHGNKTRPFEIRVVNPDPGNFIDFFYLYDWYSGLALSFSDNGYSYEFAPGSAYGALLNGTRIEVRKYGGTSFGKLLGLCQICVFILRSTSIRIGPPSEGGINLEMILILGFFTASWILIVYVFLRQRAGKLEEVVETAG
ncbi:MAG: hypothetical protein ACPL4E_04285 [Thermoproteota archaeon]